MKINWKSPKTYILALFAIPAIMYGGSKPDVPPVVTTEGITLKSVVATANYVDMTWESTDDRVTDKAVDIQRYNDETKEWVTCGTVPAGTTSYRYERFTVDRTNRWRIACDVTE